MFDIGNYDHVFRSPIWRKNLNNAHMTWLIKIEIGPSYCPDLYDLGVEHALQLDTNVASIF